jgi:SRSO17 transposase
MLPYHGCCCAERRRDHDGEGLGPHFARAEDRHRAEEDLSGLVSPVERKNAWQLAAIAGDRTPYGRQHRLGRSGWEADGVRDERRGYVTEHLGAPDGILVVDETCFPKQGTKSVGVARA